MKDLQIPKEYNYIEYPFKKKGLFFGYEDSTEVKKELIIIGETYDSYIERLFPTSKDFAGEDRYILPIGIHKTRLIEWLPTQLELF